MELSFKVLEPQGHRAAEHQVSRTAGRGFSLLVIIAAEFTPIQLGFGFTLIGVGGLLGINRTMVDRARCAPACAADRSTRSCSRRTRSANAPPLIADAAAVFPPAEGRFTFGPMVKIGWGPTASCWSSRLALILELPIADPAGDPRPDQRRRCRTRRRPSSSCASTWSASSTSTAGEVSVDASLVDSRLADLRAHRRHGAADRLGAPTRPSPSPPAASTPGSPPPPAFPKLDRLAISLARSDNPRVRLETYFALTSNTVQFGARLDLYAGYETFVGKFSAAAWASIDAMVQFDPFGFVADLDIGFMVAHNDNALHRGPAQGIAVRTERRGTSGGFVSFDFFGHWEIPIRYDSGATEQPLLPAVDLAPELVRRSPRPPTPGRRSCPTRPGCWSRCGRARPAWPAWSIRWAH